MKLNLKAIAIAMMAVAVAASCSKDDEAGDKGPGGTDVTLESGSEISGEIDYNLTLVEDGEYTLTGKLHVTEGYTLTIEPGVVITSDYVHTGESSTVEAKDFRYILVEQGAKIVAEGTKEKPILMTSVSHVPGAWGGIHICGYAPVNTGNDNSSEIGSKPYGGDKSNDNSGVLKYIILEYTGQSLDQNQECNGISFYGVGNGTTVEYCHAYKGTDDGFEFFGGTVDVKYMIATDCEDDSFDWTDGWVGRGQFLVAYHSVGEKYDCLMECDTNGDNPAASASKPVLSNVTLVGKNKGTDKCTGVMLKAGTQIELYNAIITGKTESICIKTDETDEALKDGSSVLKSVYMSAAEIVNKSDANTYSVSDFTTAGNEAEQTFSFTSNYVGTVSGATATAMTDSFFTTANFVGAVEAGNNWTAAIQAVNEI